jgi:hypothetical protein
MVAAERPFMYLAHVGKPGRNYTNICHHLRTWVYLQFAFSNHTMALEMYKILCLLVSSLGQSVLQSLNRTINFVAFGVSLK